MRTVAIAGWLVVLGAVLAWQGLALAYGPPWPTMSAMLRAFMHPVAGRVVLFGVWLWVGWHLFVQGWTVFQKG